MASTDTAVVVRNLGRVVQVTAVPREGITLAWHGSDIVGSDQGCRSLRIGGLLIDLSWAFFSRT
jgi:hypothetical protein